MREGVTILLTTHYLEEAEALCENIAVINRGQIIKQGRTTDLLAVTKENPHDKNFKGGRLEEVYLQLTQAHGQPKLGA